MKTKLDNSMTTIHPKNCTLLNLILSASKKRPPHQWQQPADPERKQKVRPKARSP